MRSPGSHFSRKTVAVLIALFCQSCPGAADGRRESTHAFSSGQLELRSYAEIPFVVRRPGKRDISTFAVRIPRKEPDFKVGERLETGGGEFYVVEAYRLKSRQNPSGTIVDVSELGLRAEKTGKRVVLTKGSTINSPEAYSILGVAGGESEFRVRVGDTLRLQDGSFEVLSLDREHAVLRNLATKQTMEIPRAAQSE